MRTFFIIAMIFLCSSCEMFEYNVYETEPGNRPAEVSTAYNIQRLLSLPEKDSIHLVLIGDTQRFYDDVREMVKKVNNMTQVDLVIITGDLADFGIEREYEWLNRELVKLKVPFLTVIGNHDCLANGTTLYQQFYGPLNYTFTWNKIRFIMHNTNGREYNFNGTVPDLNWMREQLINDTGYQHVIFVSHVPPTHEDFDRNLEAGYVNLVKTAHGTLFNAHGHGHYYSINQPYEDGIWYINTSSPSNRILTNITIHPHDETGKKTFSCHPVYF